MFRLAEVYTQGATKYADRNWEKGLSFARCFAALLRHLWKWWMGERWDDEGKWHHLAAVVWYAVALMEYEVTHPEMDDRPAYDERYRQQFFSKKEI